MPQLHLEGVAFAMTAPLVGFSPSIPFEPLTGTQTDSPFPSEAHMAEAVAAILLVMWLLGMLTHTTLGGLIHILLILALIAVVVRLIQGRRPI